MASLTEIRMREGTEHSPVYEFVTDTGDVFTSDQA